jgi:DNA invertase Pin-like site-specific DNA recombinase
MKVSDSRVNADGYRVRIRLKDDGCTIYKTIEIPYELYRELSNAPPEKDERKEIALDMIRQGIKVAAIANETGFTETSIRRWANRNV